MFSLGPKLIENLPKMTNPGRDFDKRKACSEGMVPKLGKGPTAEEYDMFTLPKELIRRPGGSFKRPLPRKGMSSVGGKKSKGMDVSTRCRVRVPDTRQAYTWL